MSRSLRTLQNQIKKPNSAQIIPGQIQKLKIPTDEQIFDEEEIMFSCHLEPPKKVIWPISESDLSYGIDNINLNFKKECIFNESDDLNLKICSKKITGFVHLNDKQYLENLEITVSSSNGIFYTVYKY